jgi:hypothetical protein
VPLAPTSQVRLRGRIKKFPDWVNNEINNKNKHSFRNNIKGYINQTKVSMCSLYFSKDICSKCIIPQNNFYRRTMQGDRTLFRKAPKTGLESLRVLTGKKWVYKEHGNCLDGDAGVTNKYLKHYWWKWTLVSFGKDIPNGIILHSFQKVYIFAVLV